MGRVSAAFERLWRDGGAAATALAPLSMLYGAVTDARARRHAERGAVASPLPVLVVGNLTVGGTGKTPLTAWLVEAFRERGWRPGIVSRGHGGQHARERDAPARLLREGDSAAAVGDEPLMLHRLTGAPVCVCRVRSRAVAMLARDSDCDLVLSDDGLQHLAMSRDAEIVVIDAAAGFGNGRLLPAGPLRERPERLYGADLLAIRRDGHEQSAEVAGAGARPLAGTPGAESLDATRLPPAFAFRTGAPRVRRWPDGAWLPLSALAERSVHAVAGIARPERFFEMLRSHGLSVTPHPFPDHHPFDADELRFEDARAVLLTSKDAVKLDRVAVDALPGALHEVSVAVSTEAGCAALIDALSERLRRSASARGRA